jgi:hypothetical protein
MVNFFFVSCAICFYLDCGNKFYILLANHHETTINNNTSDANYICDGDILGQGSIATVEAASCKLVVVRLSS